MPKRDSKYEYLNKPVGNKGDIVQTLTIKLYAQDGSIFYMPHGGDPAAYLVKGYKAKPDQAWRESNEAYEEGKARSLKVSDFRRESKEREAELVRKKEALEVDRKMRETLEAIEKAEAELAEAVDEFNEQPDPIREPKPKAKPKKKASK